MGEWGWATTQGDWPRGLSHPKAFPPGFSSLQQADMFEPSLCKVFGLFSFYLLLLYPPSPFSTIRELGCSKPWSPSSATGQPCEVEQVTSLCPHFLLCTLRAAATPMQKAPGNLGFHSPAPRRFTSSSEF